MLRFLVLTFLVASSAVAAAADTQVTGAVDLYSKYLWRGFNLCDNAVVQPSVTVTDGKVSLNVWGSWNTQEMGRCSELDYTVSYSFPLAGHTAAVGYTYYTFPVLDVGDRTQEVFFGLSRSCRLFRACVAPVSLVAYYDYDAGDGLYAELGSTVPLALGSRDGSLALALGYNQHQWRAATGFSHVQAKLTRPVTFGAVTLSPVLGYSAALSDDLDNELFWGVTSSFARR